MHKYIMRPLCTCGYKPAAVNYVKNGRTYYRSKCEACLKGETVVPKWYRDGYRLKNICDRCSFKSKYKEQFNVFHVDGNLNNSRPANLKTVCANCQRILNKEGIKWVQGPLQPDF